MTVSGSINFSVSRNDIIREAMDNLGILDLFDEPPAEEITRASRKLNMMCKAWQSHGFGLWLNQNVVMFLEKDKESYSVGTDNITASHGYTQISTAGLPGDIFVLVDSTTGISAGDYIGIELASGAMQWTTASSAAAGTIAINDTLAGAVNVDGYVYYYTTKANRPLEIIDAQYHFYTGTDVEIDIVSRSEYKSLSDKDTEGMTTQIYYDPQLTNGVIYIWPICQDVRDYLKLTFKRAVYDFNDSDDTPDFPIEWAEALSSNLAVRLAPMYGISGQKLIEVKEMATSSLNSASGFDQSRESIFIQP